jgi:diaminohydroxyphosphoribosylaminopyrimidine deaminase/5-amino-6-(5-phosphoribosylamino)uracil reductase
MRSWVSICMALWLCGAATAASQTVTMNDTAVDQARVITLGADLDPEQRVAMLRVFGYTAAEATEAGISILTITNEEERALLGSELPESSIGSYAISSAYVEQLSPSGVERLQRAGIDVQVGLLEEDARQLNASYITYMTKQRPHVIWKAATTLDGKVATRTGASRWITGVAARELVHQVRSQTDAIMVGIGTVLQDDPELTARLQDGDATSLKQPMRIIVDSTLRIPLQARCLNPRLPGQAIVATTSAAPTDKLNALRNIGIKVWQGAPQRGKVDMVGLLRDLAAMQITSVLLEGGPTLAGSMLDARLIDECMIFIAPKLFGGEQAPHLLGGQGVALPKEAAEISHLKWRQIDTDLLVTGLLKWPQETGE